MKTVTFITGASSGLGSELARLFAADGDPVALVARRGDLILKIANQISEKGGSALPIVCDVSDREAVRQAFALAEKELGPIERMIANAGIAIPTPVENFKGEDAENIIQINLIGTIYCIEAALPRMLQRKQGHIVGVSSLAGFRGLPGSAVYCASKAAIISLLESLRIDLHKYHVDVTILCPGFVKTAMTEQNKNPMPFLVDLDQAARSMYKAILKRKTIHTFPWQLALITKSARFLPDSLYDSSFSRSKLRIE